jgi:hypothetical protein
MLHNICQCDIVPLFVTQNDVPLLKSAETAMRAIIDLMLKISKFILKN